MFYEGYFEAGLENGRGREISASGEVYNGEWKDGKRHGFGEYIGAENQRYDGFWYMN